MCNFIIIPEEQHTRQDIWHEVYFYSIDPFYYGNKGQLFGRLLVNVHSESSQKKLRRWEARLHLNGVRFRQATWIVNQKELHRKSNLEKFKKMHSQSLNAYERERQKIIMKNDLFTPDLLAKLDRELEELIVKLECRYNLKREEII